MEREMKENDLLSRVETAAKEAARDLFDRINKSCQDDTEKMYDGDIKHEEQLELEKSSVEVAAAEFIKHMAEKQHSDDLENENYRCDLKNKMENAGREAGKEEYYRLKADSEIRKSKQDILKILKDSVEEAARKAARETYTLMKIQEEAITEEDDAETEGTEQLLLDEVLKAGITAAECEYDKQKTSLDDSVIDVDDEGRLRAAQRGRHAAEVEY